MSPVRFIFGSNTFQRHLGIEIWFMKVFEGSDDIITCNEQLIYFLYVFFRAQKNQAAPEHLSASSGNKSRDCGKRLLRLHCNSLNHLKICTPYCAGVYKGTYIRWHKKVKGRSCRVQERKFALALYYHSPKAYMFLSSVFSLPSSSSVHLWLRNIFIQVGWSKQTLTVLRKRAGTHLVHGTILQIFFQD